MNLLHSVFEPAMDDYGVAEDPNAEWPNNMISRRAIVDDSGLMSRPGDAPRNPVSLEEVALCQRLAREAKAVVGELEVGMGSESGDAFQPFWLVAVQGEDVATQLDKTLIRTRFGGALFPPATMTIEPLEEVGLWWEAVADDGWSEEEDNAHNYLAPWRALIAWFKEQDEFSQTAFVCIGDRKALWDLEGDEALLPAGTVMTPASLPRMAVGLTHKGSLCGLFGISVQT